MKQTPAWIGTNKLKVCDLAGIDLGKKNLHSITPFSLFDSVFANSSHKSMVASIGSFKTKLIGDIFFVSTRCRLAN